MSNRAYPTNNPFPEAAAPASNGAFFAQQTRLPYQYQANMHKTAKRQQRVNDTTVANMQSHALAAQRCSPCAGFAAAPGTYCPTGSERLQQMYAKGELYTDVVAPEQVQPALPIAQAVAQRQLDTINARQDTMNRRETLQADKADYMARIRGNTAQQNAALRGAAFRSTNASVSAAQAETRKYQDEYKKGNEEAYAHVEALQNSVRGYEDTSKETLEQLRAINNREASRRAFFTSY